MTQNQKTGAEANKYGREMAVKIMSALGSKPIDKNTNECILNGKRVVIKCSRKCTRCVGVSYKMLERLNQVIGAFETDDNIYDLYQLKPQIFKENMRETRSKGPSAGRVGLVIQKVFEEEGKFLQTVKIRK